MKAELWWAVVGEKGIEIVEIVEPSRTGELASIFPDQLDADEYAERNKPYSPGLHVEPVSVVRDGGAMAKGQSK